MPPTRRRPIPSPTPVRRPRVAGLRHPEAPARHELDEVEAETTQVIPKITEDARPKPTARPSGKAKQSWTDTPTARPATPKRRRVDDEPPPAARPADDEAKAGSESESTGTESTRTEEAGTARRNRLLVPIALAVAAVLIGGLASWFGVQWAKARGEIENTALVDNAGTSEVSGQIVSAVSTIFSYNYTDMQKTETAVQHLLTGNALCQYNLLYKVVKQQAPSQKLVLTTTVQAKGVEMLQGGTARVLLLVQQTDTRASTNQTSTSQSMIAVNAVKQDNSWKISGIDTFNGDNTTPGCQG